MSIMMLENTESLFQQIVKENPAIEKQLRRLMVRVAMDTRNAFSRMMVDLEMNIDKLPAQSDDN